MTNMTPEQRELGRRNFYTALGFNRRDFLKGLAGATAGIGAGAYFFGYTPLTGNPVRAGIIGTGDEGNVLINESNPDYLQFIAYSDIRPSNIERTMHGTKNDPGRKGFAGKYGKTAARKIKFYENYRDLLANKDIEAVVIALPLFLHAPVAIEAMKAGKHVLCEKLMAKTIAGAKEMCRVAAEEKRILAIGHQRHYSQLYDHAASLINNDILGDIYHIKALWHRNNSWPNHDSWKPPIPPADRNVDYRKWPPIPYDSLEELVRWRLYRKTSEGLMAELGGHQLDACSIFLSQVDSTGQRHPVHPLAVIGMGGKPIHPDREIFDQVFVEFEFPGKGYDARSREHREKVVEVSYSSINSNAFDTYGEEVMGTRGTMFVEMEKDVLLYKERNPNKPAEPGPKSTTITLYFDNKQGGTSAKLQAPTLDTSASVNIPTEAAAAQQALAGQISRGYREEMEHFAWCIRNPDPKHQPRCNGPVALADAVIALVSNMAMDYKTRIEYQPEWFDYKSDAVPEKSQTIAKAMAEWKQKRG